LALGQDKQETARVDVALSQAPDASQMSFQGVSDWQYDLKKTSDKTLVLQVAPLSDKSRLQLRTHRDQFIEKVEVKENSVDGQDEVIITLRNPKIQFFDYQTDQPTRLIVDFFTKEDLPKTAIAQTKNGAAPKALPNKGSAVDSTLQTNRKPAATEFISAPNEDSDSENKEVVDFGGDGIGSDRNFKHGIFDGGDPSFLRFSIDDNQIRESAIIASQKNIYLRFPALKLKSPHLETLIKNPPIYEASDRQTKESDEARLLVTLFKNGRRAVYLSTAREFLRRYPKSAYEELVRYMMADVHYSLWLEDRKPIDFEIAMGMYRNLSEKFPNSPLSTRTLLLVGYSYLDRGDNLGALKSLQRFMRLRPNTKFTDQVKLAIGEAYLNINRYDDALTLFSEVESSTQNPMDAAEAAYRKGDVHFQRRDFAKAVAAYDDAFNRYKKASDYFANAWYNKAESLFWQGQYKKSLETYREFLQRFPDHSHGGFAMTRLGELLEIMGADERRVKGAFLESVFRYRGTPGANVARIRSLVSRFDSMKEKELKSAIGEIGELEKNTVMADMAEFTQIAIADGLFQRKDFAESTRRLISYYQKNPNAANREKFQNRIVRNIAGEMRHLLNQEKHLEALKLHASYAQSWLKNSDRIDVRFDLGRAYEMAGVPKEAQTIYQDALKRLNVIKGSSQEKQRSVYEVLPGAAELNLRLASVYAKDKQHARASDHLKAVGATNLLPAEQQIEYAQLGTEIAEARGDLETAKNFLGQQIAAWKGEPSAVADLHLRVARLNQQLKLSKEAEEAVSKVISQQEADGRVAETTFGDALELKGDLLAARGDRTAAVETYRKFIEAFQGKRPLGSVRYKVGKLQFDSGDLKSAEETWSALKDEANPLWYRLAQEQLEGAKFKGEYRRYIQRIPAMQSIRR